MVVTVVVVEDVRYLHGRVLADLEEERDDDHDVDELVNDEDVNDPFGGVHEQSDLDVVMTESA